MGKSIARQGDLQYQHHQDHEDHRGNAWQGRLQLRGHCGHHPPQLLGTRSCKSQDDDDDSDYDVDDDVDDDNDDDDVDDGDDDDVDDDDVVDDDNDDVDHLGGPQLKALLPSSEIVLSARGTLAAGQTILS